MSHSTLKIQVFRYHEFPLRWLFRHLLLLWCLMVHFAPAWADDYFDPGFLGGASNVDLSVFSKAGGVAAGEYIVWVFVNQRSVGQHTLNFQKNARGKVVPILRPALLETFGVNVSQLPDLKNLPAESPIDDLGALIAHATTELDLPRLRLDISVPQIAMQQQIRGAVDPALWNDGIPALLANYNVSAGRTTNVQSDKTINTNNLFASVRTGANVAGWRLRSTLTYTRFQREGGGNRAENIQTNTRFSNTYLSHDIRELRSTLFVGENYTGSDIFDSVSFRGLKLSSNEQMLPNQLRGYSPAINGVANSNARVTVRQNGNVVHETYVAPGPFSINDIPPSGLSGNYDVTVTEADGTIRRFVVPYSSLPLMLRAGGWKYEVAAGRYDGERAQHGHLGDFMQGTAVYGLPNDITVYGGIVAANNYQALNSGVGISLRYFGALSADITQSWARFDGEPTKSGQSYRLRYSKSLLSFGTSVDLTALRYSTQHYYNFSEFNTHGYQRSEGVESSILQRRRSSFQTRLSQQMGDWGSLHFRASRDVYWGGKRSLTGLSLGYSNSVKGVNYSIHYNIDRLKNTEGNWPENRQVALNLSIPFSIFGYSRELQSMHASASVIHDNTGRTQYQSGLSGNLLKGKVSYSVLQSWGNQDQISNSTLNVGYQGSKASISGGYSYSRNTQSINMNVSGGVLVHSQGVTLSRGMGESVALISAPGAAGVGVNGGSVVTDGRGYAVVPYLSNYMRNSISLDPSTLAEGVDLIQTNINVYPTNGSVVKANFTTRIGYQVLMTLKHGNGKVPFGAIAALVNSVDDGENGSIVGDGGQVYLTGLPEMGTLLVKWGDTPDRQCWVNFDLANLVTSQDMPMRRVTSSCDSKPGTVPLTAQPQ